ncbi:MAG TPA: hypothetical protein VH298_06110 [Jatrophihabitans sp.]|nr:hypothetical protein [Jatrophihabitans sp.]
MPTSRPASEVVHAAPVDGLSFTGCCDRTVLELPRYERISHDPSQVSCGRLTETDERVLTGQPFVAEHQNSEQLLFELAVSVRGLCNSKISLPRAYQHVRTAVGELAPARRPEEFWSAELMVRIATRASQLAGY